jgi:hypothetical protein
VSRVSDKLAREVADLVLDAADTLDEPLRGSFLAEVCRQVLEQVAALGELGAAVTLESAKYETGKLAALLLPSVK